LLLAIAIGVWPAIGTAADLRDPHSDASHSQFVSLHMDSVVALLLDGFTPNRTRPVAAAVLPPTFLDSLLESDVRAALARRGILVRRTGDGDGVDSDDSWAVASRIEDGRFELSEPTRHSFLGKIWLKRSLHVRAGLRIEDRMDSTAVWERSIDTTYTDWVRKCDLPMLADRAEPNLAPAAPNTAWERAEIPAIAGGVAGALTILFLALR
jgi:hypothetical protein